MWTKTKRAVRKISKIEKDSGGFSADFFSEEAVDIYAMAHQAMAAGDLTRLHELVTSRCYKTLSHGMQYKTLRYELSLTRSQATHISRGRKAKKFLTRFNSFPTGRHLKQVKTG